MRKLAAVLSILALVSPLLGQTPHPPQSDDPLVAWVEHHPLGIADVLRATDTYRVQAVLADSVWIGVGGWWYAMLPGRSAGDWFAVVPDFVAPPDSTAWIRWPNPNPSPTLTTWKRNQPEAIPITLKPGRPVRD